MLFKYNSQQWFNTDCIETVDDFGDRVSVKLKGGREILVSERERFLALIEPKPIFADHHVITPPVGWPHGELYAG